MRLRKPRGDPIAGRLWSRECKSTATPVKDSKIKDWKERP